MYGDNKKMDSNHINSLGNRSTIRRDHFTKKILTEISITFILMISKSLTKVEKKFIPQFFDFLVERMDYELQWNL